jgi:predicted RNA-binding Zn ribbon-like protein
LLGSFAGLVRWLCAAGALDEEGVRRSLERGGSPTQGAKTFVEAIRLRTALRRGAERLAAGKPPGEAMVAAVNRILARQPAYPRLVREGGGYVTRLEPVSRSPLQLLAPVAESAAWLLEHGDHSRVRRCAGSGCVLLFYDTTKNHNRRWCSMDGCGSRAKAGAYYRRRHPSS